MLTVGSPPVDDQPGLWLSVTELAEAKSVSKQAISKNLHRWAEQGTIVATKKKGRELLVNVAQYDKAAGEIGDLAKQQAELTKKNSEGGSADPVYTREQARRTGYEADLKQLDVEERLGNLVPKSNVIEAATSCTEAIIRIIEQSNAQAEELAIAAKIPIGEARTFIKNFQRLVRTRVAEELVKLSATAVAPSINARSDDQE